VTEPCRVVILGAGPAGLGAAYQLTRLGRAAVTVLERNPVVGGLAGSFELAGLKVDYGSHRLHPACEPAILADIRGLLGDDLLDRPRHGRIRLRGRWIHFPLKPLDLLRSLPLGFALGSLRDLFAKAWLRRPKPGAEESFASVLRQGLGATICRDFYFPYGRKIWELDPEELSATQARRRVKAGSLGKLIRKVLSAVPGLKPAGAGRFYYPRGGYGQISHAYHEAARDQGADFRLRATVTAIHASPDGVEGVEFQNGDRTETLPAAHVWSTVPITVLAQLLRPQAPTEVLEASQRIRYRSMILIYLVVAQERFSEFDAHYFPEEDIAITRMSEPRNYSQVAEPRDRTVLCAELPCQQGDAHWNLSDAQLGELVQEGLSRVGLPLKAPVLEVTTRRLPQAYPIYQKGYEAHFNRIDEALQGVPGLLTFGRQGLFAHDNTHHGLAMAYAAVDCLDDKGYFDRARWLRCRKVFESHVVED
jgi:protoporphyrinogen oxidase